MLSYRSVEPHTLELLRRLSHLDILSESRLVGGTALALQYGHRVSIDLDIFGRIPTDETDLKDTLRAIGKLQVIKETSNIHIYLLDGIKVDFVNYSYPSLQEILDFYAHKYPEHSLFRAMMSLTYFDDADPQLMPQMLMPVSWEEVKRATLEAVTKLAASQQ